MPNSVDGLPGNEHGHDGGLTRASGQLERQAHQLGVGFGIGVGEMLQIFLARLSKPRGHLGQPDGGFHCLDLAEEGADATEFMVTPMLEQAGGFRRNTPLRLGKFPPAVHLLSYTVDDGGVDVLLLLR